MNSIGRKVAGVVVGIVYAGSTVNGVETGLSIVIGNADYSTIDNPPLWLALHAVAAALMGPVAAYVARSFATGVITAALGAALLAATARWFLAEGGVTSSVLIATASVSFAAGLAGSWWGARLGVAPSDLEEKRILDVSWKHWLWLWLPWQYVVANVIWLGTPRFILLGDLASFERSDLVKSLIGACAAGYAGYMALMSLRAGAGTTRWQACLRFLGWFLVVPVLVNLWRLFF